VAPDGTKGRVPVKVDNTPIECADQEALEKELARRRAADRAAATKRMRELLDDAKWQPPSGYDWHHASLRRGTATMELVNLRYHNVAKPHKGAFGNQITKLINAGKIKVGGVIRGTAVTAVFAICVGLATGEDDLGAAVVDSLIGVGGGVAHGAEIQFEPSPPSDEWWAAKERYDAYAEGVRAQYRQWEQEMSRAFGQELRLNPPLPTFDPYKWGLRRPGSI
jgi:hypothetical protein